MKIPIIVFMLLCSSCFACQVERTWWVFVHGDEAVAELMSVNERYWMGWDGFPGDSMADYACTVNAADKMTAEGLGLFKRNVATEKLKILRRNSSIKMN